MMFNIAHPSLSALLHEWLFARDVLYDDIQHTGGVPDSGSSERGASLLGPRWLFMVRDASGSYRPLRSGEPNKLWRQHTGSPLTMADLRHVFITLLRGTQLSDRAALDLKSKLRTVFKGNIPGWVVDDAARCMGNTPQMWSDHYDAGEMPRHVAACNAILLAVHAELIDMGRNGRQWQPATAMPEECGELRGYDSDDDRDGDTVEGDGDYDDV
jgi:hypothetical protein